MRYDRARHNLDRHPNYILAAYMASGTWRGLRLPRLVTRGRRPTLPMSEPSIAALQARARVAAAGKLIS
jgi:hypothetical protein